MERAVLRSGLRSFGPDALALGILVFASAAMFCDSIGKPLWLDELLTWATVWPAGPLEIWRFESTLPVSIGPPLYYIAVHYVIKLFGDTDISMRLVSMASMLVCLWFVYLFGRRSGDRAAGLLAMCILVASGAFRYGYEARTYAMVLAAASGALWFWQNLARDIARRLSLAGLAICLAIADSCHYYSVLICIPVLIGELSRALRRRAVDWPVLGAIAAGNSVMIAFVSLLPGTKAYQMHSWRGISKLDISETYRMLFDSTLAGLLPLLMVLALVYGRRRKQATESAPDIPFEETAALAGFALYPLVTWALSVLVTHRYVERYSVAVILGLSILLSQACRVLARSNAMLVFGAALILVPVAHHAINSARAGSGPQVAALSEQAGVFSDNPDGKIVMTDLSFFLTAVRYTPQAVRQRLNLLDPVPYPAAQGRKSEPEMLILAIRLDTNFPVVTEHQLQTLQEPFFVVCDCSTADAQREFGGSATVTPAGTFANEPVFAIRKR